MPKPKLPPGIREHHGKYQVRYRDRAGREHARSFRLITDAKAFRHAATTDVDRGVWLNPNDGHIPFAALAADWLETTVSLKPSTKASYESYLRMHVLPHFGRMPLASITRTDVQAWLASLVNSGLSAASVRNAYRVLARIMSEAEQSRMVPTNPAAKVALPRTGRREMRFLTPAEVSRLAEAIEPRYRALILMAGWTGLRWGELAALRIAHLDLLRGVADVRESLSEVHGTIHLAGTKSGERRTVPLPVFLCEALAAHIARYPGKDGLVFTSPEGSFMRRNVYTRHFKPALRRAGLDEGTRFHDLRHSAASTAIAMGANVKTVQQMLGHASATVTLDVYSHQFPGLAEQLREGLDAAYRSLQYSQDADQMRTTADSAVIPLLSHVGKQAL